MTCSQVVREDRQSVVVEEEEMQASSWQLLGQLGLKASR